MRQRHVMACVTCGAETLRGRTYCSIPCYRVVQRSTPLEARYWPRVDKSGPGGCWLWASTRNPRNGYGMFGGPRELRPSGKSHCVPRYAHRVAWELAHGPIPDGQWVLHSCDVPYCVNPAHLFLGTQKDNMADAAQKGRLHVARPRRHKVSTDQLPEIDALLRAGVLHRDIAARYGVSKAWVSKYANGKARQFDRVPA